MIYNIITYEKIYILIIAYLLDILFGEPKNKYHPVVYIGNIISYTQKRIIIFIKNEKIIGFFIVFIVILIILIVSNFIIFFSNRISFFYYWIKIILLSYFLKCTFAIKSMIEPAIYMYHELKYNKPFNNNILNIYVSRNVIGLNNDHIISCIIESISENYVDSLLSPLIYYFLFGNYWLIAIYIFKSISTLDSMIGYKTKEYINIGYFSAKLDDFLNYIPSRLSIFFLFIGSFFLKIKYNKLNLFSGIHTLIGDHKKTPSPNSGWSMSFVSGVLSCKLEKIDEYILGYNFNYPKLDDIIKICSIFFYTTIFTFIFFIFFIYFEINIF